MTRSTNSRHTSIYHQPSSQEQQSRPQQINAADRSNKGSVCCGVRVVKIFLHAFNVILFISGLAVGGFIVCTLFWKNRYITQLLDSHNYAFASHALFLAAVLAVIGGVFGFCGVLRENRAIILCYIFLLTVVFLLEVTVGSLSYVYATQVEGELNRTLNDTFISSYGIHPARTKAIDLMQQDFGCCGAVRFEDWASSVWIRSRRKDKLTLPENRVVPDSCCFTQSNLCGLRDHPSNIPYTGCIYKMTEALQEHLKIMGVIGLSACNIEVFGLIFSCILYMSLKRIYED